MESEVEGITSEAFQELELVLCREFGAQGLVSVKHPGGRSNVATHIVVADEAGDRFSVKYVSGHHSDPATKQHLLPTENIFYAGELSRILTTPVQIRCAMLDPIPGLGPLANLRAVVRKWHGESLGAATLDAVRGALAGFLAQYGEWVAFGLLFGLADGKTHHWTWDATDGSLGRCDLELLLFDKGGIDYYRPPIDWLVREEVMDAWAVAESDEFAKGLELMTEKFRSRRDEVDKLLAGFDDHARGFLGSNEWASLGPQGLRDRVLRALSTSAGSRESA